MSVITGILSSGARDFLRDIRLVPGTGVVLLVLSATIGGNTALYSAMHAVVLKPLPVPAPDRLAIVSQVSKTGQPRAITLPVLTEFVRDRRVFESVCGYSGGPLLTVEANGTASAVATELVTGEYFQVLGIKPQQGRLIDPRDVSLTAAPAAVAVIGHRFWRQRLNAAPDIVGSTIRIEGYPVTVIGITPAGFSGLQVDSAPDITIPTTLLDVILGGGANPARTKFNHLVGRLSPGTTIETAAARVATLWPALQRATAPPSASADQNEVLFFRPVIETAERGLSPLRRKYTTPLAFLVGLTFTLLALTCLNVSGFYIGRVASEERSIAVALALGAGVGRIAAGLAIRGVLTALLAWAVALPFVWWALLGLRNVFSTGLIPVTVSLTPDLQVLTVSAVVAIVTGVVLGLVPAVAMLRPRLLLALREGTNRRRATGVVRVLVIAQVAMSLVLLFAAVVLGASLRRFSSTDAGCQIDGLLLARLSPRLAMGKNPVAEQYYPELVQRLQSIYGVESAALSQLFPTVSDETLLLQPVIAYPSASGREPVPSVVDVVSPRFFHTTGMAVLRGRDFAWTDTAATTAVVIINQAAASRLFPDGGAVGRPIRVGRDPKQGVAQVIGVVSNATMGNLRAAHPPAVFRCALQVPLYARRSALVVRIDRGDTAVADEIRRLVPTLGFDYVLDVRTARQQMDGAIARERVTAALATLFGVTALLVAAVGLLGLLLTDLENRRREIGVRIALGAPRASVVTEILWKAVLPTAAGIALGFPAALAAVRVLKSLLFGASAADPVLLFGAAVVLLGAAATVAVWPACRACAIDPVAALRHE